MGLDITVYKITKEETKHYFSLIDDDLNYCNNFPEWTKEYKDDNSNVLEINFNDVKEKKIRIKVLYKEEVGYQRKGLNNQFYDDYIVGKIGYFVWNKEELMRYKSDYDNEPEVFQRNIIDNFKENCVCTFDW